MALYAFDGTWNKNMPKDQDDTNVRKFFEAYRSAYAGPSNANFYVDGPGARWGAIGKFFGGIFGAGSKERVQEGLDKLKSNRASDKVIDIVGFSRGAFIALDFANEVYRQKLGDIRFLGLWDTVGSMGIPGDHIDPGFHSSVPPNVAQCFHARSLDERRVAFEGERLETQVADVNAKGRLFEVWFAGVHSDVGGGNGKEGLPRLALYWMFQQALRSGVGLDAAQVQAAKQKANLLEPPYRNDPNMPEHPQGRTVHWTDTVHLSVPLRKAKGGAIRNEPPKNLSVVDDTGAVVAKYPSAPSGAKYPGA
jgi:uncharacterized protein (DUF2235 family)